MRVLFDVLLTNTSSSFLGHKKIEYCASFHLEIAVTQRSSNEVLDKVLGSTLELSSTS